ARLWNSFEIRQPLPAAISRISSASPNALHATSSPHGLKVVSSSLPIRQRRPASTLSVPSTPRCSISVSLSEAARRHSHGLKVCKTYTLSLRLTLSPEWYRRLLPWSISPGDTPAQDNLPCLSPSLARHMLKMPVNGIRAEHSGDPSL